MAVAKRSGPDFLFLANAHSQKFDDIESNKVTNIYFHDSTTQDWISVTGESVTSSNSDERIGKLWTEGTKAWFGDLGDGKHTGGPEDPRMKLIEVKAKCKENDVLNYVWVLIMSRYQLLAAYYRSRGFQGGDAEGHQRGKGRQYREPQTTRPQGG